MRNVPSLPANYWQRAGRADRRHRMAVNLTYCRPASHDRAYSAEPLKLLAGRLAVLRVMVRGGLTRVDRFPTRRPRLSRARLPLDHRHHGRDTGPGGNRERRQSTTGGAPEFRAFGPAGAVPVVLLRAAIGARH